ncbi:transglycosylase domain-containing protein [Flavobacterium sp.]|uniref:transglycosylase domain-containing protein n=1 Tax=Flavobacterium sp. TaxID=239 RepID=UPI00262448B4|nr:transglycosylase domain-containing protein [Flavobacterium sp.]MDD3003399.1 transglycosylase domain-containing protein [Flavobacterium sp.]
MNKRKKIAFRIAIGILIFLGVGILLFFSFRDSLLDEAIEKVTLKLERDYDAKLSVKTAEFDGFTGVAISDITLVPKNADTLFSIKKLNTSVRFLPLFIGDIQLGTLFIENGFVQLTKKGDRKNFSAFLKKDTLSEADPTKKRDYADLAYRLISKGLNLIPTDMKIKNLTFKLDDNGKKATINFQKLLLADKQLETSINVQTNTFTQRWKINGFADPRNKIADIAFTNQDTGAIKVPYFDERFNLKSSFDSIRIKIDNISKSDGVLNIDGTSSIANLSVNHPKIATKDVLFKNAAFEYHFVLDENNIGIDSSSTAVLNKIKLHPYLNLNTETDTIYSLKVAIPTMKAQDFIASLPKGLFTHFEGMETQGEFDYRLDFEFNKNNPKALIFDSKINKKDFKIIKYGEADLNKINGPFTYRAIENDQLQRPIFVGESNPNYTPLSEISPYLRKSVLTTEDPSFFSHRGFINEAFKQSIIKNIKTKKFSRGGSTISMQLVKNVFLTREKTLSRKLEEILLVYILENNRIVSKERMLEVYFNVIEWGPNIYGIGEASQFYFQKHPSQLNLNECLFLASIVPRPKGFMWKFDNSGNLRNQGIVQQKYLTNLMLRRGLLTSEDTIHKSLPIQVTGRARSFLRITEKDTTAIDSLDMTEFDF